MPCQGDVVHGPGALGTRSLTLDPLPVPRLDRTSAWVQLGVSVAVLVALAAVLVPWDWVPGGSLTPVPADRAFTAAQIHRAESYAAAMRVLSWSAYEPTPDYDPRPEPGRGVPTLRVPVVNPLS